MVIVLLEHRLRPGIDQAEWEQTFARMVALASEMPGFISIDGYAAADGTGLAVARFESEEAVLAWKTHPEHLKTQARGREAFFESYRLTVAAPVIRDYSFEQP